MSGEREISCRKAFAGHVNIFSSLPWIAGWLGHTPVTKVDKS